MKPPYELTNKILKSIAAISELIGEINAAHFDSPSPKLRKQNRIRTIHSSLKIEGNTLTEQQITAILENKRVIGPEKDIQEVINAVKVYENIGKYDFKSQKSFLAAHKLLMAGLIPGPGKYRTRGVGIVKGTKVEHLAPPATNVMGLMNDLFQYLSNNKELALINSCVFHYEMEFIHPFIDGNGRMGRLWQTLILMDQYPVFQFIPLETLISREQNKYYAALAKSDKTGHSTPFIEYMLPLIEQAVIELLSAANKRLSDTDRLAYFINRNTHEFSRKEYLNEFKDISSATASRDLKKGLELGILSKTGTGNKTKYEAK